MCIANVQPALPFVFAQSGTTFHHCTAEAIFHQLTLCESFSVCNVAPTEQWERRNQQITSLREALKENPTDLERANRYWLSLAGDRAKNAADLRSGSNVIEAYRAAGLS